VSDFLEANVPEADAQSRRRGAGAHPERRAVRAGAAQREQAGPKPLPQRRATQAFMTQAVLALSDAFVYPAPMAFQLKDFKQVQASVFQVTRPRAATWSTWGALCSSSAFLPCSMSASAGSGCGSPPPRGQRGAHGAVEQPQTMDVDREFTKLRHATGGS
jgi:cytochrome c biogenesis protein